MEPLTAAIERAQRLFGKGFGILLLLLLAGAAPAQTFRAIPDLHFVRHFGDANPLPQILTVASTGANFRFNVTTSTNSGGDWLSVTGCLSSCDTPHVIRASIAAGVALAAGTYTGQIVLKEHFTNATSITIPVTLVIAPASDAILDNLPGAVDFSLKTSGLTPPDQFLSIRNVLASAMAWTATASTADGGAWLTLSAGSGNAPSMLGVHLVKAALPGAAALAGTFIGQVRITANGRTVTVPVSVTVGDAVFSQINALSFTKSFGGANPLPQVITAASTGANFRINVTEGSARGGDWITVTGCLSSCDTPHALTIAVNPLVTLPAGTYTSQVVVEDHFTGTKALTIPVILTIAPAGGAVFDNLPGQLSYSMVTSGATPVSQDIQLRNAGGGAINWTVVPSTSDGGAWLTVSANAGGTPSFLTVGISVAALPNGALTAGTFTGQLLFRHNTGEITVPVTIVVGANVFSQQNALHFTKPFGGADPLPQTVTVASMGANFRTNVTSSTANGGNWLSVTGCSSSCDTPRAIYVAVTPLVTLPAGTYTGQVVVTEHFTGTMTMVIPVTLTIHAAGTAFFANMPGQVSFFVKQGGGGAPPSMPPGQDIHVMNGGGGTLDWTLTRSTADGGGWLNVSVTSGTAPSAVRVTIVPSSLPNLGLVAGTFVGELVFQSASGRITIPVSVSVGNAVFTQVNAIGFVKPQSGQNPLPQILTIGSTGANFRANVQVNTGTGGNWLTVTGCFSSCDTPVVLRAIVNADLALAPGSYTAQIVVTEHFTGTMAMTIPVKLTIAAPGTPFFDNVQGQMAFSIKTGTGNPPSLDVELRNAGAGSLDWTLETSTSDGGVWLTANVAAGSTPAGTTSVITASVNASLLPNLGLVAGTHVGQLLFKSGTSKLTIPVSVAVGDDIFTQLGPLHFSRGFGASNPLPQVVAITSTGANFRFNAAEFTGNGGDWLTLSGCFSSCDTPTNLTASITAGAGLAAGTYTGEIVVTEHFSGNRAMTLPVILTIAPVCNYSLSPASANPASSGGPASVNVLTQGGCPWTAVSNDAWINITSGAPGNGNGTVNYTVAANPSTTTQRVGSMTIAGLNFTVTQPQMVPGSAPTITSPAPGQVANVAGVSFGWTAVAGATGYNMRIQQGGNTVFQGNLTGSGSTSTLVTLANGSYTFSVRSCNGGFGDAFCGAFVAVSFSVSLPAPGASPAVTFPANNQNLTTSTHAFTWTPIGGAGSYQVEIDKLVSGNFIPELRQTSTAAQTIYSVSSGAYRMRAAACTVGCGAFSAYINFTVTLPPVPTVAPTGIIANAIVTNLLTCNWNAVPNADIYILQAVQLGSGPGGGALTVASARVAVAAVTNLPVPVHPLAPPNDQNLYIFIQACNGDGCGPNSSPSLANGTIQVVPGPNTAQPILATPISGITVQGPGVVLSWSRIPGDTGNNTYRLFVNDFSRNSTALDILTKQNFWAAFFRAEGTVYGAVVAGAPPAGNVGPGINFVVTGTSATAPTMVTPRHQDTGVTDTIPAGNILLGWTPVPGATLYEYFVAESGFGATAQGITPGLNVQVPLPGGKTLDGIVRACPAGNTCNFGSDAGWGPWSNASGGPGITKFITQ